MKHTSKFRSLAAFLLTIGSLAGGVNGATIMFDSLETANNALNQITTGSYSESGFTITGVDMYYAGQTDPNQYAGSAGLHLRNAGATITLTDSSFDPFSIQSIGLSVLRNGAISPVVGFTGTLQGGGVVTQNFQPLTFGFTNFNFSTDFTNLVSLSWNQGTGETNAHQFDNILVNNIIPEPSSALLFGLAALGFSARRRR